eukprot:CAMPEP_0201697638 /NCGR_PEP_ID=MMETSP0578-20130828/11431_1 /ASSEMBLY_ACC=CAM_ASM_000663 /TAXON_ID=267565 /ORGANISM="Skeletonema grethea, Strain CCMP 1804" /LENGTH=207 /DNA_ID=CAMNT_0048183845 /DNA_START=205 /DNA_END=828 /DNA_ORIENTATION=+
MRLKQTCPFCRQTPETREDFDGLRMKRLGANDPFALVDEGLNQYEKGDYKSSFEHRKKAAELGNVEADFHLSSMYQFGYGVEKDRGKAIYHLEEAAIGGHPDARAILGQEEWKNGNAERTMKHWIIAATLGHDVSLKNLMTAFKGGFVSKEELATALRAHQTAVDATKSPHREAAEKDYSQRAALVAATKIPHREAAEECHRQRAKN